MTMTIKRVTLSADRADWLDVRRPNVNASEMATVCGEGNYGSLAETFAEKKGLRPPRNNVGVLRRGRYGEAAVFEALADEHPAWSMLRAKIYLFSPELRIGATPDGFASTPTRDGPGVIQAKTSARKAFRRRFLEDPEGPLDGPAMLPIEYQIQVEVEMRLAQSSWGIVAVLVTGEYDWTLHEFEVEPNPVIWDRCLYNTEQFFRNYLDAGIMPPYEPLRDAALIRALYPTDAGTTIDLREDNRAVAAVEEYTETQAALTRLKKQKDGLQAELTGKLGPHTYGLLADGRCLSFKTQHRRAYTAKATDYRVLRILNSKPDNEDDDDE